MITLVENEISLEEYLTLREKVGWKKLTDKQATQALANCLYKVKAVDATGAGDAFWGGFLSSLLMSGVSKTEDLNEDLLRKALEYGNASGGLCVQKMGGIPALPTKEDIEAFLA